MIDARLCSRDDMSASYVEPPRKHRPRRTAAGRRSQQLRSDTRAICRLLAGLGELQSHRGSQLPNVGRYLLSALQQQQQHPAQSSEAAQQPHQNGRAHDGVHLNICRHFLRGRCYYDNCRFAHVLPHGYGNGHVTSDKDGSEPAEYHNDVVYNDHNADGSHNDDNDNYNDVYNDDNYDEDDVRNQNDDCSGYNEDAPSNDNSDRQHNHDDNDNIEQPSQDGDKIDEIDDIIEVINALADDAESQQHAMEALPQHLLHEVLERLEQHANFDSDFTEDDEECKHENTLEVDIALQHLDTARTQLEGILENFEQAVNEHNDAMQQEQHDAYQQDERIRNKAFRLLKIHNMNKKILRRYCDSTIVHGLLCGKQQASGTDVNSYSVIGNRAETVSSSLRDKVLIPVANHAIAGDRSGDTHNDLTYQPQRQTTDDIAPEKSIVTLARSTLQMLDPMQRRLAFDNLPPEVRNELIVIGYDVRFETEELSEPD